MTARLGDVRVVGDMDHLTVTPEAYLVTDYKTNRVAGEAGRTSEDAGRSLAELREHYWPQMLCYALALHQHDLSQAVRTALRFTDAGATEAFRWEPDEMDSVRAELGEMLAELDSE